MLGVRIKKLREDAGMTQTELGARLNMSGSAITQYEKEIRRPSPELLVRIAEVFNVSTDYLLGYGDDSKRKSAVRIPVLGSVRAGIPLEAQEEILDYEEISESFARSGKFFALRIQGNSMEPILHERDVIIVRQQDDVDSGDIAVILVNGNDATVKKIKKTQEGVFLVPMNVDEYAPSFYTNEEIESLPVRVIGKAVEVRRPL